MKFSAFATVVEGGADIYGLGALEKTDKTKKIRGWSGAQSGYGMGTSFGGGGGYGSGFSAQRVSGGIMGG